MLSLWKGPWQHRLSQGSRGMLPRKHWLSTFWIKNTYNAVNYLLYSKPKKQQAERKKKYETEID